MPKLEDLLKQQGFTDEEIAASADLLGNQKLRGALESGYGALSTQVDEYKSENQRWADWHEKDAKPLLSLYEQERNDARTKAAGLEEQLRIAAEGGFVPTSTRKPVEAAPANGAQPAAFDPKAHKLVTYDDIKMYADKEGEAIAMANDLYAEYNMLTGGKSLLDYTADFDGRRLSGMRALRQEAIKANKPLEQYVGEKFNFTGLRAEREAARNKAAEDAIRADERAKFAQQYGDPNVRPLTPSRDPFIPRPREGDGKMPWDGDRTPAQARTERLNRAMQNQMKGAVN